MSVCGDRTWRNTMLDVEVDEELPPSGPVADALKAAGGQDRAARYRALREAVRLSGAGNPAASVTTDVAALKARALGATFSPAELLRRALRSGGFGAEFVPGIETGPQAATGAQAELSYGLKIASALRRAAAALPVATVPMLEAPFGTVPAEAPPHATKRPGK